MLRCDDAKRRGWMTRRCGVRRREVGKRNGVFEMKRCDGFWVQDWLLYSIRPFRENRPRFWMGWGKIGIAEFEEIWCFRVEIIELISVWSFELDPLTPVRAYLRNSMWLNTYSLEVVVLNRSFSVGFTIKLRARISPTNPTGFVLGYDVDFAKGILFQKEKGNEICFCLRLILNLFEKWEM